MHRVTRDGRRRRLSQAMSADELSGFLEKFSSRHEADRERLQAMMRYGETTLCRMKYIREYFGEPPGEECGHCDNCKAPAVRAPQPPVVARRRKRVSASELGEQQASQFTVGQMVRHSRFGTGEVLEVSGRELRIRFIRHGERRVLGSYLSPVAAPGDGAQTTEPSRPVSAGRVGL